MNGPSEPTTRRAGVRVALDMTPALSGGTGVSRYARAMQTGLADLGVVVQAFAVGRGRGMEPLAGVRRIGAPLRAVQLSWRGAGRPRAEHLAGGPFDLVHSLDLVAPPTRRPLVMTLHDTLAVDQPQWHPPRAVAQQRVRLAQARQADAVVANSTATAADAARHGVDPARIHVTPLGATSWARAEPVPELVGRGPYVLFLGETHPRKDLSTLVRAAASSAARPLLVLAGPVGADETRVRRQADEADVSLLRLASVADAQLPTLLGNATLLVLPSRGEGFGLPVLEAMAAGVPAVVSKLPALMELIGDGEEAAGLSVEPGDVGAWSAALDELLADPGQRARLGQVGREKALAYTWGATATATVAVYTQVLGSRP